MRALLVFGLMILQGSYVMVFDFSEVEQVSYWQIVDDGVMGGVSQGTWTDQEDYAVFAGEVSLDNNGGFSSVRVGFRPVDMSAFDGVELRVRGDGLKYSFNLQDTNSRYSHRLTFETTVSEDGEWETIRVPFDALTVTRFGREITNAAPLNQQAVRGMSILISDEQEGMFRLEVASISLYAAEDDRVA